MNIITLNRVLLNNTPLNYRRKRILTEKDFYFKTIERTFTFSKSAGGKSIKDGRAYIKSIKGNSVVWNQGFPDREWDVQDGSLTREGETYIVTPTGEYPGIVMNNMRDSMPRAGDKVLILCDFWTEGGQYSNYIAVNLGGNQIRKVGLEQGKWLSLSLFLTADRENPLNATNLFGASTAQDTQILKFKNMRYHNLTQMFQAGNEPSTIEEFNARVATLGVDLNAYNEGQVIHCNTESIKSVGDNAWDEEWEMGSIDNTNGKLVSATTMIRSKNAIRVIPGSTYYYNIPNVANDSYMGFASFYDNTNTFVSSAPIAGTAYMNVVTPSNAKYMRFYLRAEYGSTYNHDIMITLVHSGWKQDTDAGYQPYWQDSLPLPIIRKYFPQGMKSAGSAHDEIRYNKASGKWEAVQRIGSVDLGTLKWETRTIEDANYFSSNRNTLNAVIADDRINNERYILCAKYQALNRSEGNTQYNSKKDKVILLNHGYYGNVKIAKDLITIRDTSYTDAATFKAAMQGVMLYYELAEPIVTELDEADQNFRDYYNVADFGTEQSQSSVPSAALLADVGYYFKKSEVKELTLN